MKKRKNQVQENNCNVQFDIFTPTTYRHGWVEDQFGRHGERSRSVREHRALEFQFLKDQGCDGVVFIQ